MLGHTANFRKFKIEITLSVFSSPDGIEIEIKIKLKKNKYVEIKQHTSE